MHTLSLHDALPIYGHHAQFLLLHHDQRVDGHGPDRGRRHSHEDRKSTRLNSSHVENSYAVFCLEKKSDSVAAHSGSASYSVNQGLWIVVDMWETSATVAFRVRTSGLTRGRGAATSENGWSRLGQ